MPILSDLAAEHGSQNQHPEVVWEVAPIAAFQAVCQTAIRVVVMTATQADSSAVAKPAVQTAYFAA